MVGTVARGYAAAQAYQQSGHILWESAGEATVSTVLLSPKQTVPLEETVQKQKRWTLLKTGRF